MKPTLLGSVYKAIQSTPGYYSDTRFLNIGLYYSNKSKISSSLAGVLYCIVSRHELHECELWVNKEKEATGYLEILEWILEVYPNFLKVAVGAAIEYQNANAE